MKRGDDDYTGVIIFIVAWFALVGFLMLANQDDGSSGPDIEGPDICYGRSGAQPC